MVPKLYPLFQGREQAPYLDLMILAIHKDQHKNAHTIGILHVGTSS